MKRYLGVIGRSREPRHTRTSRSGHCTRTSRARTDARPRGWGTEQPALCLRGYPAKAPGKEGSRMHNQHLAQQDHKGPTRGGGGDPAGDPEREAAIAGNPRSNLRKGQQLIKARILAILARSAASSILLTERKDEGMKRIKLAALALAAVAVLLAAPVLRMPRLPGPPNRYTRPATWPGVSFDNNDLLPSAFIFRLIPPIAAARYGSTVRYRAAGPGRQFG